MASGSSPEFIPTAAAKLLQSCPTLCDPIDGSPPGSPVIGLKIGVRRASQVALVVKNLPEM